jgi:hypothetical protein
MNKPSRESHRAGMYVPSREVCPQFTLAQAAMITSTHYLFWHFGQ